MQVGLAQSFWWRQDKRRHLTTYPIRLPCWIHTSVLFATTIKLHLITRNEILKRTVSPSFPHSFKKAGDFVISTSHTIYTQVAANNKSMYTCNKIFHNTADLTSLNIHWYCINLLTPELNPSTQRCLTRFFTEDVLASEPCIRNIRVQNQQMHQLLVFIQFIVYGNVMPKHAGDATHN
jgi:hypothetical protein